MKTIEIDARRYAWCHGHGLWLLGMPVASFIEDMHGALAEEQYGLLRYAARQIGEICAVILTVMLFYDRPIPAPAMRASWALDRLKGHELGHLCLELVRGAQDIPPDELVENALRLVEQVRERVGRVPDVLTPQGYFPALRVARDWLNLLETVDEDDFLPHNWIKGSQDA